MSGLKVFNFRFKSLSTENVKKHWLYLPISFHDILFIFMFFFLNYIIATHKIMHF